MQVVQGLGQLTEDRSSFDALPIMDLLIMLKHSLHLEQEGTNLTSINLEVRDNVLVHQHFWMMSILRNLVINALEASEGQNSPQIDIRCQVQKQGGAEILRISVQDNGLGIPEKDLELVFQPGYSTKFSAVTGNVQRGLGLTLVADIIREKYNGEIKVESKEGNGTLFQLTIPVIKGEIG